MADPLDQRAEVCLRAAKGRVREARVLLEAEEVDAA